MGDLRLGGRGASRKLTADNLGFAGGWREIVSVSSDSGTRHVGQRPSDSAEDSHCHRISALITGKEYMWTLHLIGADNRIVVHST